MGLEEQFEKGIEKGKFEIARNMKGAGIAVEVIELSTGLSREKIERIQWARSFRPVQFSLTLKGRGRYGPGNLLRRATFLLN